MDAVAETAETEAKRRHRREFLGGVPAAALAQTVPAPAAGKGRFRQSVTKGVFGRGMAFDDTCRAAAELRIQGYDLIGPEDWPLPAADRLLRPDSQWDVYPAGLPNHRRI